MKKENNSKRRSWTSSMPTAWSTSFHPCENTASIVISKDDLLKFLSISPRRLCELAQAEWQQKMSQMKDSRYTLERTIGTK